MLIVFLPQRCFKEPVRVGQTLERNVFSLYFYEIIRRCIPTGFGKKSIGSSAIVQGSRAERIWRDLGQWWSHLNTQLADPIAATYTGTGVPAATRTGQPGCAVISLPAKSTSPVSKMDLSTVKCSRRRVIVLGHEVPKACRSG